MRTAPVLKQLFLFAVLVLCAAAAPAPVPGPQIEPPTQKATAGECCVLTSAEASAKVDRLEILEFGRYQRGEVVAAEPPAADRFGRVVVSGWKHLDTTRKIPALLGTTFGFRYRVIGRPAGETAPLLEATLLPPEGVKSPQGTRPFTRNLFNSTVRIGDESAWMFTFDYRWEMVPGIWTIQIWSGSKKVGEQAFEIFVPPSV
jgi:hypothetical protein